LDAKRKLLRKSELTLDEVHELPESTNTYKVRMYV
jgi:hypothetical protein